MRPTPKPTTIRPPPPTVEAVVGTCQEGQYSQSGPDCSVYQWCVNGQLIEQGCQAGLHWNQQIKVCDWPANANCPFSGRKFLFKIHLIQQHFNESYVHKKRIDFSSPANGPTHRFRHHTQTDKTNNNSQANKTDNNSH